MTDDRFERLLADAAREYHRPPEAPREEMWRAILARRAARRRPAVALRAWVRWGAGIAAVLALGVGIGRWSARGGAGGGGGGGAGSPRVAASTEALQATLAYRIAAGEYLTRTEALLIGFRAEARSGLPGAAGAPGAQFPAQARDLLATTRLLLDSPAARDPGLKALLEDLELVLVQIAELPRGGAGEDVQLIEQGLDQRSVLLRLRTAIPAGPGAQPMQGAL